VTLFLCDSLFWITCSSVSSLPAAHWRFAFKTLLMLHHSYRKWKSLELQPAGRAQCGAACSRLLAAIYYMWASKSSLIPFFFWSFKPFKTQWGLCSTPLLILKYWGLLLAFSLVTLHLHVTQFMLKCGDKCKKTLLQNISFINIQVREKWIRWQSICSLHCRIAALHALTLHQSVRLLTF